MDEKLGETTAKLRIDVLPEYDSKDTIVYMGSFVHQDSLSHAKYESCSLYFFYGRANKKLGSAYMCFIFSKKITQLDLLELQKELPILKKMTNGSLELKNDDGSKIYAHVFNEGSYKTVRVWMYK